MWLHKSKFKNQKFRGRYNRTKNGKERIFELVNVKTGRVLSFESHWAAKEMGWKKESK
jgi:hypothetical protein